MVKLLIGHKGSGKTNMMILRRKPFVRHGNDDKAESQSSSHISRFRNGTDLTGDTAGKQYKHKSTDELSQILFEIFHNDPPFPTSCGSIAIVIQDKGLYKHSERKTDKKNPAGRQG